MVCVLIYKFRSEKIIVLVGVTKTHRLPLLTPTALMAPGLPDAINESNLTIGPKAVKDMIEHFPLAKGAKSDPQLIWSFGESEVELRSLESSFDPKGLVIFRKLFL
jgi:cell cycle checkpoint control protein RAD9A